MKVIGMDQKRTYKRQALIVSLYDNSRGDGDPIIVDHVRSWRFDEMGALVIHQFTNAEDWQTCVKVYTERCYRHFTVVPGEVVAVDHPESARSIVNCDDQCPGLEAGRG